MNTVGNISLLHISASRVSVEQFAAIARLNCTFPIPQQDSKPLTCPSFGPAVGCGMLVECSIAWEPRFKLSPTTRPQKSVSFRIPKSLTDTMKPEPAKVVDKLDLDAITPASSRLYSVDPVDPLVSIPSPLRRRNSQVTHASITSKQSGPLTVDMRCSISSGEALVHSVLPPTGVDSPGFERSRVLASSIRRTEKIIIFVALMILAIAHSLDNFLRVLYQVLLLTLMAVIADKIQFNVIDALGDNGFIGAINTIATLSTATLTVRSFCICCINSSLQRYSQSFRKVPIFSAAQRLFSSPYLSTSLAP